MIKIKILVRLISLSFIVPLVMAEEPINDFTDFYGDADFVSIATGSKQNIDKAPAIASVITAQDITNRGARNLVEALAMVPGLNVSRSSQTLAPRFHFRGITSTFAPQALLMVNGIPLKSVVRGDSHIVWGEFPVHSIARIEVIRGPGSALYGADAYAGVINVITKSFSDIKANEAGALVGSFDTVNPWFNFAFGDEKRNASINIEFVNSDGQDSIIESDAQSAIDTVAAELFGLPPISNAPGQVNAGFQGLDIFADFNYDDLTLKLSIQDRTDVGLGQGAGEALDPIGRLGSQKIIADVQYTLEGLAEDLSVTIQGSYYFSTQEIEEDVHIFPEGALFGAFPDGLIGGPGWKEDNVNGLVKGLYTGFSGHNVAIGFGAQHADLFEVTSTTNFFPDLTPRPNGIEDVSDTPEVFLPEVSREHLYAYAQDIWQLAPDWELTTGIRWDHYSDFGTTINPRVALVWSSSLDSTTKLLYGRAFRAPSFAELFTVNNPIALGNLNLEPEVIDTVELSYIKQFSDATSATVSTFYYSADNFITFVADANNVTQTAQNVGQREGKGVELELNYQLNDFSLSANYSYVKATDQLLNDDVGEYPNHQFKASLNWQISPTIMLNLNANIVGDRERTPLDDRAPLEGFSDIGFNLQYQPVRSGWLFSLRSRNIFDENILEPSIGPTIQGGPVNIPGDLPQAGIAFYGSVSRSF
jgi:iron complex outermembrane receptor protein